MHFEIIKLPIGNTGTRPPKCGIGSSLIILSYHGKPIIHVDDVIIAVDDVQVQ